MPPRYAKRVDENQPGIVEDLRNTPGVTVAVNHDDILVGYNGRTYWFEVKNPDVIGKNGKPRPSALKRSQVKLRKIYTGHYPVVWTLDQILEEIGLI